jgi:hypothetical protein
LLKNNRPDNNIDFFIEFQPEKFTSEFLLKYENLLKIEKKNQLMKNSIIDFFKVKKILISPR